MNDDYSYEDRIDKPAAARDRDAEVMACLRNDRRPYVTICLVAAVVVLFLAQIHIAIDGKWAANFRAGLLGDHAAARHQLGGVNIDDLQKGEWWRLITSIFVHRDIFQLMIYLSTFFRIGMMGEQLWGHLRFLVVFLLTGFGSICIQLLAQPTVLPYGMAGSIFGILLGLVTWYTLNKKHIPPPIYRMGMRAVIYTMVWWLVWFGLLAILLDQDLWWVGYVAGGASGIFVAAILNQQQFLTSPIRWMFLVLLFILPVVMIGLLVRAQHANPEWRAEAQRQRQTNENEEFEEKISPAIRDCSPFLTEHWEKVDVLISKPAAQRDLDDVKQLREAIAADKKQVEKTLAIIAENRPVHSKRAVEVVEAGEEYVKKLQQLIESTERCLDAGDKLTEEQIEDLKKQYRITRQAKTRYQRS